MSQSLAANAISAEAPSRPAFEELVRKTHRQAFGFAFRLTGNVTEAEDLVQETYLRAFRFFNRYDPSLPFTSWLYRIMSNANVDSVRRRGRLRYTSLDQASSDGRAVWEIADYNNTPGQDLMDRALGEPIQQALVAMKPQFRTAVLLSDVEGMAYEEIAEIMKTSVGTVRSRIHRGRRQIRAYLLNHHEEPYGRLCDEL